MADGCVYISESTADALGALNVADVNTCNAWGKMAELLYILKELPDDEHTFPRGKWATIQEIERQVQKNAREMARNLRRSGGGGKG